MEPYRDDELSTALQALRPTPAPAFAAKLDARVAAGFPREPRSGGASFAAVVDRVRALKPRQVLLPVGATALAALAAVTVVVSMLGPGGQSDSLDSTSSAMESESFDAGSEAQVRPIRPVEEAIQESSDSAGGSGVRQANPEAAEALSGSGTIDRQSGYSRATGPTNPSAFTTKNRAVERSAEITLGTDAAGVGDAAAKVFDVVHANRGIVLNSSTSDGAAGAASAEFELLIPSAKLGDAMAAFSGIAEVLSRHEATNDITAPTVGIAEHLEDSKARIDSLLAQLAAAETESEREAVEAELRTERNRAAALGSQLQGLERRANLSRVSLRIESGEGGAAPDAGGSWGIGDALHDAGQILAVAVAVTLVGLAILGPIALIALLAWLAHRAWVRRGRRQALS